jgi:KUP system potassium uptake protein
LATAATVIASQALISGAFSETKQVIQLGFLPRLQVLHTSVRDTGQIYIPLVNWGLFVAIVLAVALFKSSSNLAAAYGISVTSTMMITAILLGVVMYREWKMNLFLVLSLTTIFFTLDFAFWSANLIKIKDGGWYPLFLGLIIFTCLITWYRGRKLLRTKVEEGAIPLQAFVNSLLAHPPHRVEGTAIFLTAHVDFVPIAMLHNLKHNRVMHERIFFVKLSTWDVPYVNDQERLSINDLGGNIFLVRAVYGFKESPDINKVLSLLSEQKNIQFNLMDTSFFVARDTIVPSANPGMAIWREKLFGWMMQNAAKPSDFFKIPTNRLVELGAKVEI